jgi:hypothetical protein
VRYFICYICWECLYFWNNIFYRIFRSNHTGSRS